MRYLPCPVCGELMSRRNFADVSGVILDWCRGHGWWFDAHELERVIRFLEGGGMEQARRHQHERRKGELERLARQRERELGSLGRSLGRSPARPGPNGLEGLRRGRARPGGGYLGLHNVPLAAPAALNLAYQFHTRRAVGWTIVTVAVVANLALFAGSLVFLASGQSFEEFSGM